VTVLEKLLKITLVLYKLIAHLFYIDIYTKSNLKPLALLFIIIIEDDARAFMTRASNNIIIMEFDARAFMTRASKKIIIKEVYARAFMTRVSNLLLLRSLMLEPL
jgi:hypothetical protein